MEIKVLRKMIYETDNFRVFVYVFHFARVFQYLFVWNSQIYEHHIEISKTFIQKIKSLLFPKRFPLFSDEEIQQLESAMLSGATKSIDSLSARDINKTSTDTENPILVPLNK